MHWLTQVLAACCLAERTATRKARGDSVNNKYDVEVVPRTRIITCNLQHVFPLSTMCMHFPCPMAAARGVAQICTCMPAQPQ